MKNKHSIRFLLFVLVQSILMTAYAASSPFTMKRTIISSDAAVVAAPALTASVSLTVSPSSDICVGTAVTFTAIPVNGGTTPQYKWFKNNLEIAGETGTTLQRSDLANGDGIKVKMTSNAVDVTTPIVLSPVTTMTVHALVTPSVSLFVFPCGQICAGTTVIFNAEPSNEGTSPQYKWFKNDVEIIGETGYTLQRSDFVYPDRIRLELTANPTCSTTPTATDVVTLSIDPLPTATIVAPVLSVCGGSDVQFNVTGSPLSTVFFTDETGTPSSANINILGHAVIIYPNVLSNKTLTLTSVQSFGSGCFQTLAGHATVSVKPLLTPDVQLSILPSRTICAGTPVTFSANTLNGGNNPQYKWFLNDVGIPGETGRTLQRSNLANGDQIKVEMRSDETCLTTSTALSDAVVMTVNPLLTPSVNLSILPTNTICAGTQVSFTATPTNGGTTPAYKWFKNNIEIVGETSATLQRSDLANGDNIKVQLTSNAVCLTTAPTVFSTSIAMTVNPLLTPSVNLSISPSNTICAGTQVTFTATPTNGGTTPQYKWVKNNIEIVGETSATLQRSDLANGDNIKVQLTSNAVCLTTAPAVFSTFIAMTANPLLTPSVNLSILPSNTTICAGTQVTFTANPTNGGTTPVYKWFKNTIEIVGATGATLQKSDLANADNIQVQLTSNEVCLSTPTALSPTIAMTVNTFSVAPTSMTGTTSICKGNSTILTVSGGSKGTCSS